MITVFKLFISLFSFEQLCTIWIYLIWYLDGRFHWQKVFAFNFFFNRGHQGDCSDFPCHKSLEEFLVQGNIGERGMCYMYPYVSCLLSDTYVFYLSCYHLVSFCIFLLHIILSNFCKLCSKWMLLSDRFYQF